MTPALAPLVPKIDRREAKIAPLVASPFGICAHQLRTMLWESALPAEDLREVLPLSQGLHVRSFDTCAWRVREHNHYLLADVSFRLSTRCMGEILRLTPVS